MCKGPVEKRLLPRGKKPLYTQCLTQYPLMRIECPFQKECGYLLVIATGLFLFVCLFAENNIFAIALVEMR